ncbi:MAG: hypothetical protein VX730_04885 [Pseudomonadota bacterium]|nr:hypothetical protein [Pseudomonadota bacterium]
MPKPVTNGADTSKEWKAVQSDLNALKTDVTKLTQKFQNDITETAKTKTAEAKAYGKEKIENVESRVQARPLASMAIAFGAGLVLSSVLLKGKRNNG